METNPINIPLLSIEEERVLSMRADGGPFGVPAMGATTLYEAFMEGARNLAELRTTLGKRYLEEIQK